MAREVLPWVGMAVGAYFGNPQLGFMIGSLVGNAVDPERIKGPSIGEAQTQTSREGVYRPIVLGIGCVAGNIINRGPEVVRIQRDSQGKGGPVIESERRYRTFAIRICEGPIAGLLRIWENETLVYDSRPESQIPEETVAYSGKFRFYNGYEDQLPDPDLEKFLGTGNAPAYRGSCYIVFPNYDLTEMRDMVPQYRFEVASAADAEALVGTLAIGRASFPTQYDATSGSANGIQWGDAKEYPPGIHNYTAAIGNRYVVWNSISAYFTDDLGDSWNGPYGSFGGIGGDKQAFSTTDTLIIPGGFGAGVWVTQDAETFVQRFGVISNNCAINQDVAISISLYEAECRVSYNKGISWELRQAPPVYQYADKVIACNSFTFMIGGQSSNIDQRPIVARTINYGMAWSEMEFPGSSASYVKHITPCGEFAWVAVMNNGEIWYAEDGTYWEKASQELGLVPSGLAFNGLRAIVSGTDSGPAKIMTAEKNNLADWTVRGIELSQIRQLVSGPAVVPDVASSRVSLASIVNFCHRRVYQSPALYDTAQLSDILVDGVVFADGYAARDAILTVIRDYYTDAVECDDGSGYRIQYVRRGGSSTKVINLDDIVDEPEETKREDALERPRVLHLHFQSPIVGYAPAKASIQRISPDAKVSGEVAIQTPITYTDQNEAWRVADIMMRQAWTEVAGRRTLSLADSSLDIVPTDVLTISLRGRLTRERVLKSEYAEGFVRVETIADRQSNYTSNVTGPALPVPTPPPPSLSGTTVLVVMDIPALADNHDRLGYYVAATGVAAGWRGAVVQRSVDGGAGYANVVTFDRSTATVMGTLISSVTSASQHYTDTTNVVEIRLFRGGADIESLTQQQFLSEGGAFALEWDDDGEARWEILQYRDAEQDEEGTWRLSHLARGRLNTQATAHLPGARFVMLDGVQFVDATVAMIGAKIMHRAVSAGTSPESATPQEMTYRGRSQMEWPVAHLFATESEGGIALSAIPRHRFGTEDHPVRSANWDGYRWSATDGTQSATVETTANSVAISTAGWSTPVTVSVAQLNRITGASPTVSEVIQ